MNDTYPDTPGHRGVDTSIDAAEMISSVANRLRHVVHKTLCEHADGLTCDEVCAVTGHARYSLQPRFTELKYLRMIRDTGQRRRNESGAKAIVWRATVLDRQEAAA